MENIKFRERVRDYYVQAKGKRFPLGMGCATIGAGGDEETQKRFLTTLDAAYQGGVRYYDTSAKYGGSEYRVGQWLKTASRDTIFLATKSPLPSELTPNEAAVHIRQSLHNSLERLGVDHIDLFQIHDVETLGQSLAPEGALESLLEAKREGLISYIGLGTRYHDLLETAVDNGHFDSILTYLDYTLLDQSSKWLIEKAEEKSVGAIQGSPLSFGLLTGQDPRKTGYSSGEFRSHLGYACKLYDYCQRKNLSLLALALQFPMSHSGLSITLTGPASPQELQAGLEAASCDLPPAVWEELNQELQIPIPGR